VGEGVGVYGVWWGGWGVVGEGVGGVGREGMSSFPGEQRLNTSHLVASRFLDSEMRS